MATYDYVDLKIPDAKLAADLNGISFDLRRARYFAEQLISELQSRSTNWSMVEPLSIAISVTYARAFSTGVRRWLSESDLQILSSEQRSAHDYIYEYRNKHVAHSVNEFEENLARAYYCIERVQDEGISSIGYGGGRVSGLSERDAHAVVELTNIFEKHLEQQIADENKRLLELVRLMPIRDVLSMGKEVFVPRNENIGKRRKS